MRDDWINCVKFAVDVSSPGADDDAELRNFVESKYRRVRHLTAALRQGHRDGPTYEGEDPNRVRRPGREWPDFIGCFATPDSIQILPDLVTKSGHFG